jgi:hypothetical protein
MAFFMNTDPSLHTRLRNLPSYSTDDNSSVGDQACA